MNTKSFYESPHCVGEVHCGVCRSTTEKGEKFRTSMLKVYPALGKVDFDCPKKRRWGWQLGDMVASIATPIARVLKMDCIDKQTQQLKIESPCAKKRRLLNQL